MNDPTQLPTSVPSTPSFPGTDPGFFRFRVGGIEVITLNDGGVFAPRPPGPQGGPGYVFRPLACLLVRLPGTSGLVLMDAGFGPNAKRAGEPLPTAGRLLASLSAAGVAPEDIGTVLLSHIHPDHVDGLYDDDGAPTFVNAVYRVGAEELAFWSQDDLDLGWSPAPDSFKAEMMATSRRLLQFAGTSLKTFRAGEPALPGIGTMLLPGHTPGQVGFVVSDGGEHLLYVADALTTPEISVGSPDRLHPIDLDPGLGVTTRKALVGELSRSGWHSFSPHFPWPNLGVVQGGNDRFAWKSVDPLRQPGRDVQ